MIDGRVTKLATFGVFVEIQPELEGLVHVSEISEEHPVARPEDHLAVGQTVTVRVLRVDTDARNIGLSLKHAGASTSCAA